MKKVAGSQGATTRYQEQLGNVTLVYNVYRVILPLILLVMFTTGPSDTRLGALDPVLFVQVSTAYAIFGVVVAFFFNSTRHLFDRQGVMLAILLLDILAIDLLVYTCGGVASGLGLLLLVIIAAGSILIRGIACVFLAAVATLAIFYCELYLSFYLNDPPNQFLQAGILGAFFFATSFYVRAVSERMYRSAVLAEKQASNIVDLEHLNRLIIHRIKAGILVVNTEGRIITANSAANGILRTILQQTSPQGLGKATSAETLPPLLKDRLEQWQRAPARPLEPFSVPGSNLQILSSFAYLNPLADSDILISLEDHQQIVQRVRQGKLASLGRLTASIAHEIRNPLGAISHASQLLRESGEISATDRRMVDIIQQHCQRVNSIVETILDASRHRDIAPEQVVLKDWLKKFIDTYTTSHPDCDRIDLTVEPEDMQVSLIPGQMEQVLNNLFENGLRYSKKATGAATLVVRARAQVEQGEPRACLEIIDDGPGITNADGALLFEPFYTTEPAGTGLGLYISKELCDANGARLIYGRTGAGKSCFSIYFNSPAALSH